MGDATNAETHGEDHIPYAQIAPLLRPGMTAEELGAELARLTGLRRDRYCFYPRGPWPIGSTLHDRLKGGLWISTWDDPRFLHLPRLTTDVILPTPPSAPSAGAAREGEAT